MPAYPSGAQTRSFRFGRGLSRLAVTLATQPFSNVSRAFTMSSCPPNTVRPEGVHVAHRAADQRQDQVEVVDHQVEDGPDVGRPAGERAVPLALDQLRR